MNIAEHHDIIPTRDTTNGSRLNFRIFSSQHLVERAIKLKLANSESELKIRGILPRDLGLVDWTVPKLSHHVLFVDHEISRHQVICIYKVLQLGIKPAAHEITFRLGKSGSVTLGSYNLDSIYAELPIISQLKDVIKSTGDLQALLKDNEELVRNLKGNPMEGYFTEPIIYSPEFHVRIELDLRHSSDDYLVLGGYVCERAGVRIT